jgi:hypothetical protein
MPTPDTLADLLEARLAVKAASRELSKFDLRDPRRPEVEAAVERAIERYRCALQAHEQARRPK